MPAVSQRADVAEVQVELRFDSCRYGGRQLRAFRSFSDGFIKVAGWAGNNNDGRSCHRASRWFASGRALRGAFAGGRNGSGG